MGYKSSPYLYVHRQDEFSMHKSHSHPVNRRGLCTALSIIASLASIWLLASLRYPQLVNHTISIPSTPSSDASWLSSTTGNQSETEAEAPSSSTSSPSPPPPPPPKAEYPANAAVIIETRITSTLVPVILHFASILGPDWPVVLFTLESEWQAQPPQSPPFQRALRAGRVRVQFLPAETTFHSHHSVSLFLTSPWLWEQVEDADRVLLFQTDSVLCANSDATVDDFAEWDLIGAPIDAGHGHGYNGGLSLRNPRLMLDIAREDGEAFARDSQGGEWWVANELKFEDQWFYTKARDRGAHLPPPDLAKTFAVESIYYETPLGYHQPGRWQQGHMTDILEWCPEVAMLSNQYRFS